MQALPELRSHDEFNAQEAALLRPYFTNLHRPVFALRNLPEVVKGALFSRYSRTEKSLRRVLLEEFIRQPELGLEQAAKEPLVDDVVARARAEEFYERVLIGYGDDSVAELAGAHLAVEQVSTLAAKALEDSRIGISPLEKSTRYVRFDRPGPDGRPLYHRGPELAHPAYERAADRLFQTYSSLIGPLLDRVRQEFAIEPEESERAWKAATRARALDLVRGLLPAGTLTNVGLYGNGRSFEYLITKMAASELPECQHLASSMHTELSGVIPSFVRRALDEKYGAPAAARLQGMESRLASIAPRAEVRPSPPSVRLVEYDREAERKVVAAALYSHSNLPLEELAAAGHEPRRVLEAMLADRTNRRHRPPRALEHASYTFEVVANFAAYRDLQRHRMLTQGRQPLGVELGYDLPEALTRYGFGDQFAAAIEAASFAHSRLAAECGETLAQYVVPLAFRIRWYLTLNLRELYHLCELRTTPQGHPDYRVVAQEMYRRVHEVHPDLVEYARFVDLGPGDDLERRRSERRIDEKLDRLA